LSEADVYIEKWFCGNFWLYRLCQYGGWVCRSNERVKHGIFT